MLTVGKVWHRDVMENQLTMKNYWISVTFVFFSGPFSLTEFMCCTNSEKWRECRNYLISVGEIDVSLQEK